MYQMYALTSNSFRSFPYDNRCTAVSDQGDTFYNEDIMSNYRTTGDDEQDDEQDYDSRDQSFARNSSGIPAFMESKAFLAICFSLG